MSKFTAPAQIFLKAGFEKPPVGSKADAKASTTVAAINIQSQVSRRLARRSAGTGWGGFSGSIRSERKEFSNPLRNCGAEAGSSNARSRIKRNAPAKRP